MCEIEQPWRGYIFIAKTHFSSCLHVCVDMMSFQSEFRGTAERNLSKPVTHELCEDNVCRHHTKYTTKCWLNGCNFSLLGPGLFKHGSKHQHASLLCYSWWEDPACDWNWCWWTMLQLVVQVTICWVKFSSQIDAEFLLDIWYDILKQQRKSTGVYVVALLQSIVCLFFKSAKEAHQPRTSSSHIPTQVCLDRLKLRHVWKDCLCLQVSTNLVLDT